MIKLEGLQFAGVGPIDMTIESRELTVVIGPNGAGKSLLLKMLHGLVTPTGGMIRRDATAPNIDEQAFVAAELGFLNRSAEDNLVWLLRVGGMGKSDAHDHAQGILSAAGLMHVKDRPAGSLSAGEQALLGLARGLVPQPKMMLLDEPTAHLDPNATKTIEAVISDVRKNGQGIVMTTHDLGQARRLAEHLVILVNGKIAAAGPAQEVLDNPPTEEARTFLSGGLVL